MRKQNTINLEQRLRPGVYPDPGFNHPEKRPRPGLKPDQGFYHPEPKPIYRPEPKLKRDKNGNIIVRLDNGSYVVIDPQGNASPYKPPKLPVFPEGLFKPQYPPRRPDSWNPWPENPNPWKRPRPRPIPWNDEIKPRTMDIRYDRDGYPPGHPAYDPNDPRSIKPIPLSKRMRKRAIPTQRTDNTRNKYGI